MVEIDSTSFGSAIMPGAVRRETVTCCEGATSFDLAALPNPGVAAKRSDASDSRVFSSLVSFILRDWQADAKKARELALFKDTVWSSSSQLMHALFIDA
eukprot:CAMPEP_0169203274 /NCGR_PEP_ID=MMETSP1016-20121227/11378_1 /TAXON_ID=342587 /ORGANISM="Karlodinium micrum, Strain CCMP2283" /LENGTH=98 /DNA_ID=CAMNT_0009280305 /DNA_START=305 /DNA_END=601 /DNA_ORIENTATION=-